MRETKYKVRVTSAFKRDYKRAKKRGKNMTLLKDVIMQLAMGQTLAKSQRDHELTGNFIGYRECHIQPDWVLIYRVEDDVLILTLARTGSHSDLL
jgi:mRNA interferase YafQ